MVRCNVHQISKLVSKICWTIVWPYWQEGPAGLAYEQSISQFLKGYQASTWNRGEGWNCTVREVEIIDMLISFFMIIISTSLNVRGQPSPRFHVEAWLPFRNCEMDYFLVIACVAGGLVRRRKIRWGEFDFWRHVEQTQKEEKNWREGGGGGDEKDRLPAN